MKECFAIKEWIPAEDAFTILEGMIERSKVEFPKTAKEYAFEWLFDCVHDTGMTDSKCILDIFEDTVKQIKDGEFDE